MWRRRARCGALVNIRFVNPGRGSYSGPIGWLRTTADAGRWRAANVDCLCSDALDPFCSFKKVCVVKVNRVSAGGVSRHYALQKQTFRLESYREFTVPRPDPDTWVPPDPRAKRHADLRTVEAWQRSRRRRRMEIAAAILLLAGTAAAWSVEVAIGPDRAAEIRAVVAESLRI